MTLFCVGLENRGSHIVGPEGELGPVDCLPTIEVEFF